MRDQIIQVEGTCVGTSQTIGPTCLQVLHLWVQPTTDQKYFLKEYVVANVYYVVRLIIVVSILNVYRHFFCHYPLNDTGITTIYTAFTLY